MPSAAPRKHLPTVSERNNTEQKEWNPLQPCSFSAHAALTSSLSETPNSIYILLNSWAGWWLGATGLLNQLARVPRSLCSCTNPTLTHPDNGSGLWSEARAPVVQVSWAERAGSCSELQSRHSAEQGTASCSLDTALARRAWAAQTQSWLPEMIFKPC